MREVSFLALAWASAASTAAAQRPDTLPPVTVSVARADLPLTRLPFAIAVVNGPDATRGRTTWGLDEALAGVPGVFAANRYNFSLDQRLAIRGFGARSAFAVRGIKILLDGIPQTLPDGQGQLTHVELGVADRIEVLRGSASALYGNASGGVISIWTDARPPARRSGEVRVVTGSFGPGLDRTWTKWQGTGRFRVGSAGGATLTLSRLSYEGARDHSAADLRAMGARLRLPLGPAWSLTALADVGDQPRADNPGALNLAELGTNRDAAAPQNLAGGTTHVLDGRRLPGIPRQALRLALRTRPASLRGAWAEVETQHASGYAVDDTLNRQTSPSWVTNLRVGWDGAIRGRAGGARVAPFVAVQNLFNRKYVGSVVVNAAAGRYYEPAPGRNLLVGLTVGAGR
jgi:outer membrane receptor protein involved in Fe transport